MRREVKACGDECVIISSANPEQTDTFNARNCFFSRQGILVRFVNLGTCCDEAYIRESRSVYQLWKCPSGFHVGTEREVCFRCLGV